MGALLTHHPDAVLRVEPRVYHDLPGAFDIDVTHEDIRLGLGGQATMCAVARAAKRVLGFDQDSNDVTVCDSEVTVWNGAEFAGYDLGDEAAAWIARFDLSDLSWVAPVRPTTFRAVRLPGPRDSE